MGGRRWSMVVEGFGVAESSKGAGARKLQSRAMRMDHLLEFSGGHRTETVKSSPSDPRPCSNSSQTCLSHAKKSNSNWRMRQSVGPQNFGKRTTSSLQGKASKVLGTLGGGCNVILDSPVPSQTSPKKLRAEEDETRSWRSLPVDIQIVILGMLDQQSLFQATTQCKAFKECIESKDFHALRGKMHAQEGSLTALHLVIRDGVLQCGGYDVSAKQWKVLPPFKCLPCPDAELFKEYSICGAGGLMCANVSKSSKREELIIFNPLTRRWRKLPCLNYPRNPVLMHMIVNLADNSYRVIVAGSSSSGDDHLSKITEVFDSRTSVWKVTEDLHGPLFALNEHQSGIYVNGIVYCIAFLEGECGKGVIAYSVDEEKWLSDLACPLPDSTSSNIVQLVESNSKVYLLSEHELDHGRSIEHRISVLENHTQINATSNSGTWKKAAKVSFEWRTVMTETKVGSPGLQIYPEYTCISFGEGKLCVFNTIEHTGIVYDIESGKRSESLYPPTRSQTTGHMGFYSLNPLTFSFEPSFKSQVQP